MAAMIVEFTPYRSDLECHHLVNGGVDLQLGSREVLLTKSIRTEAARGW